MMMHLLSIYCVKGFCISNLAFKTPKILSHWMLPQSTGNFDCPTSCNSLTDVQTCENLSKIVKMAKSKNRQHQNNPQEESKHPYEINQKPANLNYPRIHHNEELETLTSCKMGWTTGIKRKCRNIKFVERSRGVVSWQWKIERRLRRVVLRLKGVVLFLFLLVFILFLLVLFLFFLDGRGGEIEGFCVLAMDCL